ncbi:CheY-like receiver domain-containing protein [Belliella baltica DSM 15883]|uniref:CheY-like receiver domain-containing protein n=1 Tax=Belliella baltica (strain DSM 15883 / CIP 108006 / LMG 21964 / BA134) TaxID=866536 RepID=I3Z7C0_BELBD|nr:response regulator [Belliella baltica]AFL85138.1 CheY-like receiver domain-containing protein [Belliella baltica DSM 15883]
MKNVHILLVEDNEGDILLTLEALEEAKMKNTISVVKDGEKAIQYVEKLEEYKDAIYPDLIILDVNLPKLNGHEVLQYLKNKDEHMHIPVIMLTTSSSPRDINEPYKNHVNCFITKPIDVEDFIQAVLSIENFWINLVKLPLVRE